jgi:aromatic ring-opening dioxygenase catalytic subunit (LigB family)
MSQKMFILLALCCLLIAVVLKVDWIGQFQANSSNKYSNSIRANESIRIDNTMEHQPTSKQWTELLNSLPDPVDKLPAVFLAHGSPMLLSPEKEANKLAALSSVGGPRGLHKQFLKEFGPFLLKKYKPKAIVVFSAHWETRGTIEVMSNDENELYYDYYGFPKEMYEITWKSKGSHELAERIIGLFKKSNIPAKASKNQRGLDHGVFIPFKIMFPDPFEIPLVEVSIDEGLDPERHIAIGKAIDALRSEGVLIISGGLTIHTFQDWSAWNPDTAAQGFKDFENDVKASIDSTNSVEERNKALVEVSKHPYYRKAHPRTEHFIPIYVAAGAGSEGKAKVVCGLHGAITAVFGL